MFILVNLEGEDKSLFLIRTEDYFLRMIYVVYTKS